MKLTDVVFMYEINILFFADTPRLTAGFRSQNLDLSIPNSGYIYYIYMKSYNLPVSTLYLGWIQCGKSPLKLDNFF